MYTIMLTLLMIFMLVNFINKFSYTALKYLHVVKKLHNTREMLISALLIFMTNICEVYKRYC